MKPLSMTTPTETTIEITRSFDAPVAMVWRTHTEPELVKRWMTGPSGHSMPECDIDLRVGGSYRFVWAWDDKRMSAYGSFREIEPKRRLLMTETYDIAPESESLVEQVFSERDGQTTVKMSLHYDSKETRDGVLQSPMDEGLEASYRSLDALIAETV